MSLWRLLEIKLAPDVLFYIGPLPVTNTLLCTWLTIVVLVLLFYFGTRRRDMVPRGMQNFMEWVIELLLGLAEGVSGKEKAKKFFPLVAVFFVFIIVSNLLEVIPGVDTVGFIDFTKMQQAHSSGQPVAGFLLFGDLTNQIVPLLRPATTDLNLNFAMALIAVISAQVFGFIALGPKEHLSKYFNVGMLFRSIRHFDGLGIFQGFIEFFVGLVEIISEIARVISLAFRLFGNIFAGGAVLAVFALILPFVADIAFIPLELFVAFVQALVFSLLTLVYMEIATTGHPHDETEQEAHAEMERNARAQAERAAPREAAAAH